MTILVVDLEATCWDHGTAPTPTGRQNRDLMEVIEFGCALAEPDGSLLDAVSFFVRPVIHPILTDFCVQLTGITQSNVDAAPPYPEVCQALDAWLNGRGIGIERWGSWGNYDRHQLLSEQARHGVAPGFLALPHTNLKTVWHRSNLNRPGKKRGLASALKAHGLSFDGQHHRGVDDATNIVRLFPYMDWNEAESCTIS